MRLRAPSARLACCQHSAALRRSSSWAFTPPPPPALAVLGSDALFPVNNVYCVGRNYSEHAREMRELGDRSGDEREPPFFFLKPGDAVVAHRTAGEAGSALAVPYPPATAALHYEVELVACLSSGGRDIPASEALDKVFGYAVGLDLTRRDLQDAAKKAGRPWTAAKAFASSAPCTPIAPVGSGPHVTDGRIWLEVDGELRQDSDVSHLTWDVAETIEALSASFTLSAGDIIMTGTPAGVGAVVAGQRVTAGVEALPELRLAVDIC